MSKRIGIGWNAEDQKKGMTLEELRDFVDSLPMDMDYKARVRVTIGWGGQVRIMRVEEVEP
jgi:hypothetical protein